jgi:hypothetical protein
LGVHESVFPGRLPLHGVFSVRILLYENPGQIPRGGAGGLADHDVMKQILLIDQEFGAGAATISEKLAARLNWNLFDDALTQEIARLAKIPVEDCRRREERTDPWLHRLINVIWRGSFDRNLPSPDLAILDTDRLVSIIQKVIEQAAEKNPASS